MSAGLRSNQPLEVVEGARKTSNKDIQREEASI